MKLEIKKLEKDQYSGHAYSLTYTSKSYYDICNNGTSFSFERKNFEEEQSFELKDEILSEWLDNPVAYGAFDGEELIGYVEGFLESWNNRFRISNIAIFNDSYRKEGMGSILFHKMEEEANSSGARMLVLETQSCNEKAISFYRKMGLEVIGFDLFAYTNEDYERHQIRVEMGKKLCI